MTRRLDSYSIYTVLLFEFACRGGRGSAYSRSLRVAAPLGTGGMTGGYGRPRRYDYAMDYAYARARAARRTTRAPAALCVWNGPVRPRRDDPVCRENGYIVVKTDIYY